MRRIVVEGGRRLSGEVQIGGSKNAALPILFAGILTGGKCLFVNLPRVSDVLCALEILRFLGARISFLKSGEVSVDYSGVRCGCPPVALTSAIRGSTYLLGAMLARFGEARLGGVGGCDFGSRPIDQHLLGFERMGAREASQGEMLILKAEGGMQGAEITLAMPSVGATANLMMAAVLAKGETVIFNAAAEPHVTALADFLISAGAKIRGVGSSTVCIEGVKCLNGVRNVIIPDMIEAGTYLALGLACTGPVRVRGVEPSHLGSVLDSFRTMGAQVEVGQGWIMTASPGKYRSTEIVTGPFPAFPTDLHPQLGALFCLENRACGMGRIDEMVWEARFGYVKGLCAMGAKIKTDGKRAEFYPSCLHAERVSAPDLRGGAALLIAALATPGRSEILNAFTIGRGYEHLEDKLSALGARIKVY